MNKAVAAVAADATSVSFVFQLCSYLPLIGLLTWFLPNLEPPRAAFDGIRDSN